MSKRQVLAPPAISRITPIGVGTTVSADPAFARPALARLVADGVLTPDEIAGI